MLAMKFWRRESECRCVSEAIGARLAMRLLVTLSRLRLAMFWTNPRLVIALLFNCNVVRFVSEARGDASEIRLKSRDNEPRRNKDCNGARLVMRFPERESVVRLEAHSNPDRFVMAAPFAKSWFKSSRSMLFKAPAGLFRADRIAARRFGSGILTGWAVTTLTRTVAFVLSPVSSVTVKVI